jgi:hypothetical protein
MDWIAWTGLHGLDGMDWIAWTGLHGLDGMDWINLYQDRDSWCGLVMTVKNFRVSKMQGVSWLAENLLTSQEGLCSLYLVGYFVG